MALKTPPGVKQKVVKKDPIQFVRPIFENLELQDLKLIQLNWAKIREYLEAEINRKQIG